MNSDRICLEVDLFVIPGREEAFLAYEAFALGLLPEFGGIMHSRIRFGPESHPDQGILPYERHVVSFPDQNAFDAYLAHPERQSKQTDFEAAVERVEMKRVQLITEQ